MGGRAPPPVPFVLTTATFAFLFLERTEASVPLSSFMVPGSLASLRRSQSGRGKGELSPDRGPPLPHRRTPCPSPQWPGHSPLPPLPRHGAGRGIEPQAWGAQSRRWGEDGRPRGPGPARAPRTPLPLPRGRRREPPGPVWKMADGPGVACHPWRRQQPAVPGPNSGWGSRTPPRNPCRPIAALGAGAASVSPSTPPLARLWATLPGTPR